MNCKDCKNSRKVNHYNDTRLECINLDKISDGDGNLSTIANDELVYEHQEGGKFFVGEYFGCVHFAPKSKLQQGLDDNKLSEPMPRVDIDRLLDASSTVDGVVVILDEVKNEKA